MTLEALQRVHITGASGCGTSTLGGALAARLEVAFLDTDDYYWEPSDPPFQIPQPYELRQSLLRADLDTHRSWVLSGSLLGWGDVFVPRFELVVFLWLPTPIRIARLRARELEDFGTEALAPGGLMHENHRDFLEWAASYDDGDLTMRSLANHEEWLAKLDCRVLRLEGEMSVEEQVANVLRCQSGGANL